MLCEHKKNQNVFENIYFMWSGSNFSFGAMLNYIRIKMFKITHVTGPADDVPYCRHRPSLSVATNMHKQHPRPATTSTKPAAIPPAGTGSSSRRDALSLAFCMKNDMKG